MAAKNERWFSHLYINTYAKGRRGEALDLEEALKYLVVQDVVGTADSIKDEQRFIIQLLDIDLASNKGYAILLFLLLDRERADAVYGDVLTFALRTASKLPTEGGATSAHMLINLTSLKDTGSYRCVLEDAEGLSRSRLIPYLRWLLQKFVVFVGHDDHGREINLTPNVDDDAVLDRPITEQLNEANLIAVDVFRKAKAGVIDREHGFYEKTRTIEYRPVRRVSGDRATEVVKRILAGAPKEQYPEARVRIEEDTGRERAVSVDRTKKDVLAAAFQLRTLVTNISPPVDEATKTIVPHLVKKMLQVIKK